MKFCNHCGNQVLDEAVICPKCGCPIAETAPVEANAPMGMNAAPVEKKSKKKLFLIGGIALAVIALIVVLVIVIVSKNSLNGTVKAFVKAVNDRDAEKVADLLYPEEVINIVEEEYDDARDELVENVEDLFEDFDDYYGDDWEVDFKVKKIKDVKGDDLEEIKEAFEDEYDFKITEAKKITIKMHIKGEEDSETETETFCVYKCGDGWGIGSWDKYDGEWYVGFEPF